jgi:hypothetical protein
LREGAATAAHSVALGLQGLLDIATSVMPENRNAENVVGDLLAGTRLAMELAGFDPDERERGQLYRAIVEYIGEEDLQPRLLGGASSQEDAPNGQ